MLDLGDVALKSRFGEKQERLDRGEAGLQEKESERTAIHYTTHATPHDDLDWQQGLDIVTHSIWR
jgi:hypothetical protein